MLVHQAPLIRLVRLAGIAGTLNEGGGLARDSGVMRWWNAATAPIKDISFFHDTAALSGLQEQAVVIFRKKTDLPWLSGSAVLGRPILSAMERHFISDGQENVERHRPCRDILEETSLQPYTTNKGRALAQNMQSIPHINQTDRPWAVDPSPLDAV